MLLACTALTGCPRERPSPGPPDAAPVATRVPEAEPEGPGKFVLVPRAAKLYAHPSTDAEALTVCPKKAAVMKVVGPSGQFFEVAPVEARWDSGHCFNGITELQPFELTMFVERGSVARVTTAQTRVEFDDGTSATIAPGAMVGARAKDRAAAYRVGVSGQSIVVPLDAAELGRRYDPGKVIGRDNEEAIEIARGATLRYGGDQSVEVGDVFVGRRGVSVFGSSPRGEDYRVTMRTFCLELTGLVAARAVLRPGEKQKPGPPPGDSEMDEDPWATISELEIHDPDRSKRSCQRREGLLTLSNVGLIGKGTGFYSPSWEVAAGTPVSWADGTAAGTVRSSHKFKSKPEEVDERLCFETEVGERVAGDKMRLCFDRDNVTERRIPRPKVRQAKATVEGKLDKDIIRRIVRAHLNELRYCYYQGLKVQKDLAGGITVDFVIGKNGRVSSSKVASTTVADDAVNRCVGAAVERWRFPKPKDGKGVRVRYPFVFSPS